MQNIIDDVYHGGGSSCVDSDKFEYLEDSHVQSPNPPPRPNREGRPLKQQSLVFWPRLAPVFQTTLKSSYKARPTTTLLLCLLLLTPPPFLLAVLLLPPLLLTDELLHATYTGLKSLYPQSLKTVEITTSQAVEVMRLYVLLVRVGGRTTGRIVARLIRRRGGVTGVAREVVREAIERVKHPVKTVGMVWSGVRGGMRLLGRLGGALLGGEEGVAVQYK